MQRMKYPHLTLPLSTLTVHAAVTFAALVNIIKFNPPMNM